ncbi:PA3496 family putative envelope integrity protein [Neptunomonas antarctica]|uniref:Uncharacterized protein n=1 Tax=Neptunomonas antarctica TaxID=619304 RepID=A0A1N7IS45_9GAMM|nr:hypothetical protein [Neptunomonas antarctica]SIS39912.1 hypothetical protein SAMN05421760_10142 [Neptunomonas antarctica]
MMKQKISHLSEVQIEIINTFMGYEDVKNLDNKKQAVKRLFRARRAIEEHRERRNLTKVIDREVWFDEL